MIAAAASTFSTTALSSAEAGAQIGLDQRGAALRKLVEDGLPPLLLGRRQSGQIRAGAHLPVGIHELLGELPAEST